MDDGAFGVDHLSPSDLRKIADPDLADYDDSDPVDCDDSARKKQPPPLNGSTSETIAKLAALHPIEYDRVREAEAQSLGVRVGTLDKEVGKARERPTSGTGAAAAVEILEPWDTPVSGLKLANAIRDDFNQYVVADQESIDTLTIWVLGTHVFDAFQIWPKAFLSSPEKRCGKSTTVTVIEANVCRSLLASSITASALFRAVDLWRPTLILDEADRMQKDNEELTAVINAGHLKRTAKIIRNVPVGDGYEPRTFSVWSPMVLAAIGKLADTVMDRSIVIPMRRKFSHEKKQKVPTNLFEQRLDRRRQCHRWAIDAIGKLVNADVKLPAHGNDRALDNWTPLFAIAKLLAGDWPNRIKNAFNRLAVEEEDTEAAGPMLLQDIRDLFDAHQRDRITSAALVDALVAKDDRPWFEWKKGKPITQNSLSRLLAPYRVKPTTIRIGDTTPKGYYLKDFSDAFRRYLSVPSGEPPHQTATPQHSNNINDIRAFQTATSISGVAVQKSEFINNINDCCGVAVGNGERQRSGAVAPAEGDPIGTETDIGVRF